MTWSITPAATGIYLIRNLVSGKAYVGSALNLQKRHRQHWADLRAGRHFNRHLQAAWKRDGELAFAFEVVEFCERNTTLPREQFHLDRLNAADRRFGYNSRPRAESNLGHKFSAETVERNRRAQTGRKQSPELIERRIAPLRGRRISEEHRAAIGAANAGRSRPDVSLWAPSAFAKFGAEEIAQIRALAGAKSMRALAKQFGCSAATIHRVIHGGGPCYR